MALVCLWKEAEIEFPMEFEWSVKELNSLGFMLRAVEMYQRGFFGLMTSADIMPRFASRVHSVADRLMEKEVALSV